MPKDKPDFTDVLDRVEALTDQARLRGFGAAQIVALIVADRFECALEVHLGNIAQAVSR
jgi:hypothetical protein